MKLITILICVACASAIDPGTMLAVAAKSKAAQEVAGGVADIFENMGEKLSNEGEDTFKNEATRTTNMNLYLDILQKINSGQLKVKRELVPDKDVVLDKLSDLYDRVRAYVNGGAAAGLAAYEEALDQLRVTYQRFKNLKSLNWLKRWVQGALEKIEEKLNEYEASQVTVEKRELLPPHDEVIKKFEALYERIRVLVNGRADEALETYRDILDRAHEAYLRVRQFKSLQWLKRWIVDVINKLDQKLQEYAIALGSRGEEKRELVPTKEELLDRLANLYNRFRAYVNAGADTALDAYGEGLDYIRYLINRFESIKSLQWATKWIEVLLDRADKRLQEYENDRKQSVVERREIIPSQEEVLAKIGLIYDKLRGFVNDKSDRVLDMYKGALDEIREVYENVERIKSLSWLKRWTIDALNALEVKLNEWEQSVQDFETRGKRSLTLPSWEEVRELGNKLRNLANEGVEKVSSELEPTFTRLVDTLQLIQGKVEENETVRKVERKLKQVFDKLNEKVDELAEQLVSEKAKREADLVKSTEDPLITRLKKLLKDLDDFFVEHPKIAEEKFAMRRAELRQLKLVYEIYGKRLIEDKFYRRLAIDKIKRVEKQLEEAKREVDRVHELYRRALISNLEEHFDARTARGLGDKISGFFKDKWNKINETFVGFKNDTKASWKELINDLKPVMASVQSRGNQILDDTRNAAIKIRQAAIKSVDDTIHKMLVTANNAINDGRLIVDTLKNSLETFAQELK